MFRRTGALSLCAALLVSGCDLFPTSPVPAPRDVTTVPEPKPEPSPRSQDLAAYYSNVQQRLLSQGLLRVDGGGPDTPFSKRQVVNNFVRIAAYNEFSLLNGQLVETPSASLIKRWSGPIRMQTHFGETVPEDRKASDTDLIGGYAARLANLTGQDIRPTGASGNFHIAVLDVDALEGFGPKLKTLFPGLSEGIVSQIATMPRDVYCAVYVFEMQGQPNTLGSAIAIVRAEHPDLLRQSCYHEEIAQGLGLNNDSAVARPSIFNDDNEFALLTRHDELLLDMLYDERLPLGANPTQVRQVAEVLAAELLDGES
ncbi:DUF2927 domain-containing protein [Litoreibacter roseus]|nr:DUF2927 domain-containing protein [Litoreibacter roseus]